jgi:aminopeptidase N
LHKSYISKDGIKYQDCEYKREGTAELMMIVDQPFPTQQAMNWLKENSSYVYNHIITDCEVDTAKCSNYLKYNASDDTKAKIIAQNPELVTKDTFKSSLKVRQAIAQYVKKIPFNLKSEYETLLNDKSLITIESALYNLWLNFPAEGSKYLYKTRNLKGLNNSLRILWLVLHLNTPEYQVSKKEALLKELINYTDKKYNAETRMTAFHYINLMKVCNAECLSNLEEAKTHHNWRMVKFAKKLALEMEDTDIKFKQ